MPETKCDRRKYDRRSLAGRVHKRVKYQTLKPARQTISRGLKRTSSEDRSSFQDYMYRFTRAKPMIG